MNEKFNWGVLRGPIPSVRRFPQKETPKSEVAKKEFEIPVREDPLKSAEEEWNDILVLRAQLENDYPIFQGKIKFKGKLPDDFDATEEGVLLSNFGEMLKRAQKKFDIDAEDALEKYAALCVRYSQSLANAMHVESRFKKREVKKLLATSRFEALPPKNLKSLSKDRTSLEKAGHVWDQLARLREKIEADSVLGRIVKFEDATPDMFDGTSNGMHILNEARVASILDKNDDVVSAELFEKYRNLLAIFERILGELPQTRAAEGKLLRRKEMQQNPFARNATPRPIVLDTPAPPVAQPQEIPVNKPSNPVAQFLDKLDQLDAGDTAGRAADFNEKIKKLASRRNIPHPLEEQALQRAKAVAAAKKAKQESDARNAKGFRALAEKGLLKTKKEYAYNALRLWSSLGAEREKLEGVKIGWFRTIPFIGELPDTCTYTVEGLEIANEDEVVKKLEKKGNFAAAEQLKNYLKKFDAYQELIRKYNSK